jgi:hypothetical protein
VPLLVFQIKKERKEKPSVFECLSLCLFSAKYSVNQPRHSRKKDNEEINRILNVLPYFWV